MRHKVRERRADRRLGCSIDPAALNRADRRFYGGGSLRREKKKPAEPVVTAIVASTRPEGSGSAPPGPPSWVRSTLTVPVRPSGPDGVIGSHVRTPALKLNKARLVVVEGSAVPEYLAAVKEQIDESVPGHAVYGFLNGCDRMNIEGGPSTSQVGDGNRERTISVTSPKVVPVTLK